MADATDAHLGERCMRLVWHLYLSSFGPEKGGRCTIEPFVGMVDASVQIRKSRGGQLPQHMFGQEPETENRFFNMSCLTVQKGNFVEPMVDCVRPRCDACDVGGSEMLPEGFFLAVTADFSPTPHIHHLHQAYH